MGNREKALEYLEKALDIQKRLLGDDHPDTAVSLNNIGMLYQEMGNREKALEYLEKALDIWKRLLGDDHPDTIDSVMSLGNLFLVLNRRPEALALVEYHLSRLSKDHIRYTKLDRFRRGILQQTVRPGFRQPSSKSKARPSPKKNRHRK